MRFDHDSASASASGAGPKVLAIRPLGFPNRVHGKEQVEAAIKRVAVGMGYDPRGTGKAAAINRLMQPGADESSVDLEILNSRELLEPAEN